MFSGLHTMWGLSSGSQQAWDHALPSPLPTSILPSDFSFQGQLLPCYSLSYNMVKTLLIPPPARRDPKVSVWLQPYSSVWYPSYLPIFLLPAKESIEYLAGTLPLALALPLTPVLLPEVYPSFRVLLRFAGSSFKIYFFPHYFSSAFCWSLSLNTSRFYLYYGCLHFLCVFMFLNWAPDF